MGVDLDHQIDRAVSQMLDREPPEALRARVLSRIERPRRRRGPMLILAPIAAAAVVVLAFALLRSPATTPLPSVPVARMHDVALPAEHQPVLVAAKPEGPTAEAASVVHRRPPARLIAAATLPQPEDVSTPIAPLRAMTPIAFRSITTDRVAPEPVSVPTLPPIADVQIGPLTPPDGRN